MPLSSNARIYYASSIQKLLEPRIDLKELKTYLRSSSDDPSDAIDLIREGFYINESINHLRVFFMSKMGPIRPSVAIPDIKGYKPSSFIYSVGAEKEIKNSNILMIPILKWLDHGRWLARIQRNQLLLTFRFVLAMVLSIADSVGGFSREPSLLALLFIFLCIEFPSEAVRLDTFVLKLLAQQFETWFVIGNGVVYQVVVFFLFLQSPDETFSSALAHVALFSFSLFWVVVQDASSAPRKQMLR